MKNNEESGTALALLIGLIVLTCGGYLAYDYYKKGSESIIGSLGKKTTVSPAVSTQSASTQSASTQGASTQSATTQSATTSNVATENTPNEWEGGRFGLRGVAAALQINREANATKAEIEGSAPENTTTFNPHYKGIWKNKTGIIRERFSGKSYPKDTDLEIFTKYSGQFHYLVKYKGDMCYFPVSLINESGFWSEPSTSGNFGGKPDYASLLPNINKTIQEFIN